MDDIPEFLNQITRGRPVPPEVIEEVKHRYGLIGRSPLTELTLRQGELLAEELKLPVYVGMRNWKPFMADTIAAMKADGVESRRGHLPGSAELAHQRGSLSRGVECRRRCAFCRGIRRVVA